mgnify:CR=1 FL=1
MPPICRRADGLPPVGGVYVPSPSSVISWSWSVNRSTAESERSIFQQLAYLRTRSRVNGTIAGEGG